MPHITFAPGRVDDITEYIEYIISLHDPLGTLAPAPADATSS
jgi:hypothetical protein